MPTPDAASQKAYNALALNPHQEPAPVFPATADQLAFFKDAFTQSAALPQSTTRTVRCKPLAPHFQEVEQESLADFRQRHPDWPEELLSPAWEFSPQIQSLYEKMDIADQSFVNATRRKRTAARETLGRTTLKRLLGKQTIPSGLLSEPVHRHGGDRFDRVENLVRRGCMATCFRMIFDELTGWQTDEGALGVAMHQLFGNYTTDNLHYLGVFHSQAFRELCPRPITTIEALYTDFNFIRAVAERTKTRVPGTDVYCIAGLGSLNPHAAPQTLHSVILRSADRHTVYTRNPSLHFSQADQFPKATFIQKAAIAQNIALFVIAGPKGGQQNRANPA